MRLTKMRTTKIFVKNDSQNETYKNISQNETHKKGDPKNISQMK